MTRSNPMTFVAEHPWMTFFLGLAAISVVGEAVSCAAKPAAAAATPVTPTTPVAAGTSGLGAIHGNPLAPVRRALGMRV